MSPAVTTEAVLELTDVSRSFATKRQVTHALRGVSLRVRRGTITGIIGPDAAGKTTLLRCIAGLLPPDSGRIAVLGREVAGAPPDTLAYMPQRFGLYEDLTVQENLDLYSDLQGVPHAERAGRYEELMRMTALDPFKARRAGRLSGGMKQKLGLACALVRLPPLLLLDEPTVGVDPVSRRELWAIIHRLAAEDDVTVLVSTSYLDEAEACDDVALLHDGELLGQGTPRSFAEPFEGRTFLVDGSDLDRREVRRRLERREDVLDAVLQGHEVRVVLSEAAAADSFLGDLPDAGAAPTPPRVEDALVTSIREREGAAPDESEESPFEVIERTGGEGPIIEVQDVTRRFGDFRAVDNISFDVHRGEVFGLLGANGAGKTTTFRMLCGLLPASAGTVHVAGIDLRHASQAARGRVGYMSQKFSLYGKLTVRQNLTFFAGVYGLGAGVRAERIAWAVEHFHLGRYADSESRDLPVGYKQRLAMAAALMHRPDVLFLDEPTSGVDPLARREFWDRIGELADRGVTVMVTTHHMAEADHCDRVAIMVAGEILAIGTPAEIRDRARSDEHPEPTMEDAFICLVESKGNA